MQVKGHLDQDNGYRNQQCNVVYSIRGAPPVPESTSHMPEGDPGGVKDMETRVGGDGAEQKDGELSCGMFSVVMGMYTSK